MNILCQEKPTVSRACSRTNVCVYVSAGAGARWGKPDANLCVHFSGRAQRHSAGCVGGCERSEATTQIRIPRTPGFAKPADARRRSGGEREGRR